MVETIHSRSVSHSSDRLGVTAKMDLVEVRAGGALGGAAADLLAPLTVCPVDYKIGSPREGDAGPEIWDADRMQLGLQCLILRDNGYTCAEGVIYYRGTQQRVTLAITAGPRGAEHSGTAGHRGIGGAGLFREFFRHDQTRREQRR